MRALCKTFFLMLASLALASCGGGGAGSNSATAPVSLVVTVTPASTSLDTDSFTSLVVTVKNRDGGPAPDGTGVNATLSPATIGTLSGATGSSGTTATNTLSGGTASFIFNSSDQGGTAHITASVTVVSTGSVQGTYTYTGAADIAVHAGSTQDPRLQLVASSTTLPVSPCDIGAEQTAPFPCNYLGSPFISEVTVTWRHSNGQLVGGTLPVNVSAAPTTTITFSTLNTSSEDDFHTLLGSGPVNVTGGVGTIYVHAGQTAGTGILSVTAVDPDSGQSISSQLAIVVTGGSSGLPASVSISSTNGGVYVSGSNGPQSTIVNALVTDGSNGFVNAPAGADNVQFQIVGPAGSDATLAATNAAGQQVSGTTVSTTTSNGVANVTFLAGQKQGPVQIRATADRTDGNVDNGIQNAVSATATVVVSDGKLYSLTIDSPDTGAVTSTGVAANVVEDPPGSGNYELTISAKGVDRQGNPVTAGTQIGFGDIDSPQTPGTGGTTPKSWFTMNGTKGDPVEGGTLFTATDGKFVTSNGNGAGPGDTLLVIGKASEGAPVGNDDLESSSKVTAVNSATSLTVGTPFNLNDTTGVSVNNGPVLPYIVGRAEFSSVQSPSFTDTTSSALTGVATTTLNYPASEIGKAVAIWAQGTGTDTNSGTSHTDVVADIATLVFPGLAEGAILTASPDPLLGNAKENVTVCYYDGNNRPIPNFDISFSFELGGVGTGSVDGTAESGFLHNLTGANGCATASVSTTGLATGTSATITFSAGPLNANSSSGGAQASVTLGFVVDVGALQVSPCQFSGANSPQTVTIHVVDGGGNPLPNQSVSAACTVLSGTGSITVTAPLATDQTGTTYSIITVNPADTSTVGYCTYTSGSLVQSVGVNTGSCSTGSGGFSPTP